jgi:hypothetical protein
VAPAGAQARGGPGTSRWATRRAQWLALGLSDADMLKPKIAIVNTSSQLGQAWSLSPPGGPGGTATAADVWWCLQPAFS